MMRHEARQVPSWLIFDVSRKTLRCAAHARNRRVGVLRLRRGCQLGGVMKEFPTRRFAVAGSWVSSLWYRTPDESEARSSSEVARGDFPGEHAFHLMPPVTCAVG